MSESDRPGYDRLWGWFGLSYAGWVTIPRVLMHEMPDEWQRKMAELLEEYEETWTADPPIGTRVLATRNGKLVAMPKHLLNYRHPDRAAIDEMRRKPRKAVGA